MSFEEKRTRVYLVTSAGAYVVYLAIMLGRVLSTPVAHVPYAAVLLWTTGASIVANMAGRMLVETARPSDSRRGDRQRHLPGVRAVGGGRFGPEARRLPAGPVIRTL